MDLVHANYISSVTYRNISSMYCDVLVYSLKLVRYNLALYIDNSDNKMVIIQLNLYILALY